MLKIVGGGRHEGHLAATTLREGTGGDGAPSRAFTWLSQAASERASLATFLLDRDDEPGLLCQICDRADS
ncbi:hypothetical protein E2C01_040716 [Portunus trituberculatus]|uniref:Uncharacterized protein n=1 Tax=Portunus trituberculatus TaxID=210409 RepID=A0A5B7FKJ0_PORTR|nr:hypothetical protein [Portunus trituberculatus]